MQLDARAPEHEIITAAMVNARRVYTLMQSIGRTIRAPKTSEELLAKLDALAWEWQATPVAEEVPLSGRIARMCDPRWWSRRMRRRLLRQCENEERGAGNVRRKGHVYVSEFTLKRTIARAKQNRLTLEGMEAVNEQGFAITLADAMERSVSNPKLRRAELMTRCRGFEEAARLLEHQAVFLTLTAPSRFHRFDGGGKPNPKWDESTPGDGQKYICALFKRIRSAWKRAGFYPYGFRVVEPHHDGCPHWHILMFMPPQHVGWFVPDRFIAGRKDHGLGVVGIAGKYTLADSPGERGAAKHRYTCKLIDSEVITDPLTGRKEFNSQRTAAGYIAKYICKNVDGITEAGDGMGLDFASGKRADIAAARVRAWAGVHGIRQFQQIGGPSVTVYRELRRLGRDLAQPLQLELFEGPRAAADRGLYALFWILQGGPEVPRRALTLRPSYTEEGEGRYGEPVRRVNGVTGFDALLDMDLELVTRIHQWTIQATGQADRDVECQEVRDERARSRAIAEFLASAGFDSLPAPRFGEADAPWTGVNNCTEPVEDDDAAAIRADFLRGLGATTEEIPPCDVSNWPPNSGRTLNPTPPT